MPSYSTFRRVMQQLDFHVLAAVFTDWVQTYTEVESGWRAMAKVSEVASLTTTVHNRISSL
ncbi:transposase family protein [Chroococcidiopsis sp. CCMEE 29]|uniref:transposase family protein n=1 Tax=Chroococcidiopsis sp. CCMEE 29 TaxID=155894 RepID=UPI0020222E96|nr:transposase family protein [Chroococcidiopsis sp. CCMEE 29]